MSELEPMIEHRYTVREIEEMRKLIERKYIFGFYSPQNMPAIVWGVDYREDEKTRAVEEYLRTHMMAGHTAVDLLASETVDDGK